MRSIRKLYFQNASGDRRGLNGENGVYCTDLAGFGFSFESVFSNIGQGFFPVDTAVKDVQSSIPFTLIFTKNAYKAYQDFINWLSAARSLTIVYNPTGDREYFKDIVIDFVQKGELTRVGWLEAPCSLFGVTPWYLPQPTILGIQSSGTDERKRYPYRYTNALTYGMNSSAALSATIAGTGHIPAALELTYYGAARSPKIKLTGNISNKTFGICYIDTALDSADILKLSTKYDNSFVKKISAEGMETDLINNLDLSLTPFFHVPIDEPCTVSIESDDVLSGRADLSVYYYYRSV